MATKDDQESHHKNPRLETNSRTTDLSDLPNEVLIHILSSLPTKSAAATSLLSNRWRYLWLSIPNLNFSERLMFGNQRNRFTDFMDRAMLLRDKSPLISFSLGCKILADEPRINHWITYAIRCNVENLSLRLHKPQSTYLLPDSIFESQSLVKLELIMPDRYILKIHHSVIIGLIHLKYLKLSITFPDSRSIEKLISGCPLLRELHFWWCNYSEDVEFVNIFAPKLEILEIDDRDKDYGDAKVCIIGENLRKFTYGGMITSEYDIRATQLVDADINLYADHDNVDTERCYKFFNGLSGAQKLTLTEYFIENLDRGESEFLNTIPVFVRLTELCIDLKGSSYIRIDRAVMLKIFERCPHLEDLTISEPFSIISELNPIPSCFRTHLKSVTIHCYIPDDEDCAVNMFLKNAAILEDLIIFCRSNAFDLIIFCRSNAFDDPQNGLLDYSYKIEEYNEALNRRAKVSKDCRISAYIEFMGDLYS